MHFFQAATTLVSFFLVLSGELNFAVAQNIWSHHIHSQISLSFKDTKFHHLVFFSKPLPFIFNSIQLQICSICNSETKKNLYNKFLCTFLFLFPLLYYFQLPISATILFPIIPATTIAFLLCHFHPCFHFHPHS